LLVPSACTPLAFSCETLRLGLLVPTVLYRLEIWLAARELATVLVDAGVVTDRGSTRCRDDKVSRA
jgi:hypothetical protein